MHARLALTDAANRRDPTKTGPLRRNFAAAADQRLRTLKAATRKAIVTDNVLGFTGQAEMPAFGPAAGARAEAFHEWFGAANDQSVLGKTGSWLSPYIAQAMHQGVADAQREVKGSPPQAVPIHESMQLHAQLALHELRGISGALRQQVDRAVGAGLGTNRRKHEVYRGVNKAFAAIRPRALALTHHAVVKAYNKAKLLTYKEAGYSKVGIEPEYLPRMFARDRDYEEDPDQVNILTAGDGYVCDECEDIAASGPYDIDEADGLIPAHVNCRCAFVPFGDQRFAPIEEQLDDAMFDAFDPEEPRDEHGRWASGGGSGGATTMREKGAEIGSEQVAKITRPGHFYRGMSATEFHATIGAGKDIQSIGKYSVTGEGTNFGSDAETAESYMNFGRSDPRKTGEATYLVEIAGKEGLKQGRDGYFKAAGPIDQSRITRIFEMKHDGRGGIVAHEMVRGAGLGHGYSKQAHLEGGTIYTSNVFDAARALYENRHVILDQPRQLSTLIDHLGQVAKHMIAMGGKAPTFNLCNVSVAGTNLFCAETKGIPRVKMPQLDDDQTKLFKKYLKAQGYQVEKTKELASHLRATQNELDGVKVAKSAARMRADPDAKDRRLVVSKDNYILDGHHYWAASIGLDAADNKLGDKNMKVSRVNIGIVQLLKEAEEFTHGGGHKGFGDAFDPAQERDYHGRFGSGGAPAGTIGKAFEVNPKLGPTAEQREIAAREMFGSGSEQLSMFPEPKSKAAELGLPPDDEVTKSERVSPYDEQWANSHINDWFPNIDPDHLKVLTLPNEHYNCIASAFGDDKKFWWPEDDGYLFWPSDVQTGNNVESFDDLMLNKMGATESNELVEPGHVKIALFADENGEPTHMARQQSDGRWSSKLGPSNLIVHDLHEMEDGSYGRVEKIYSLPTEKWMTMRDLQ